MENPTIEFLSEQVAREYRKLLRYRSLCDKAYNEARHAEALVNAAESEVRSAQDRLLKRIKDSVVPGNPEE